MPRPSLEACSANSSSLLSWFRVLTFQVATRRFFLSSFFGFFTHLVVGVDEEAEVITAGGEVFTAGGVVFTEGLVFTAGGDDANEKENVFTSGAVGEKGEDGEKSNREDDEVFKESERLGD